MTTPYRTMQAIDVLDLYFIENRSRILDVAAFLDRIDRYAGSEEARADPRYQAMAQVIGLLQVKEGKRTKAIQMALSDPSAEPIASSLGLKAWGAWMGDHHEGH